MNCGQTWSKVLAKGKQFAIQRSISRRARLASLHAVQWGKALGINMFGFNSLKNPFGSPPTKQQPEQPPAQGQQQQQQQQQAMPILEGMSVKEMKEELATLGSSAEGCCERSEIEEKLRQVRQAKGGHGPAAAAGAPAPAVAGMEQFMASMTASFNTMGDSFGNMVCARLSFPRAPCSVMRKCRTK